ncbi:MAG: peptidoglycan-binding domain-containing protein [Halomonas sp.]|nr:peptidoglycan-binding domain-containing protein [Halomonas sp.]
MYRFSRYESFACFVRCQFRIIGFTIIILVVWIGLPTASSADSWKNIFEGMAKDLVEEGRRTIQGQRVDNPPTQQPTQQPRYEPRPLEPIEPVAPATGNNLGRYQLKGVQLDLQKLGYDPGPADGMMGPKTAQAISQFERDIGLPVTGLPSPRVLSRIKTAMVNNSSGIPGYNLSETTTATGSFATATTNRECHIAVNQCTENARDYEGQLQCFKQNDLCRERISSASLTSDQIEHETRQVATNCKNQTVTGSLYDCDCMANQYRLYRTNNRGGHRYTYGTVDNRFYDTDWASKCYQPNGAYENAYNSCMNRYSVYNAENKTGSEVDRVCQCEGREFMKVQRAEPGVNSVRLQNVMAEVISRCQ